MTLTWYGTDTGVYRPAYTCFTSGYKQKLNYSMRTIPDIGRHLGRIDEVITNHLIPSITGGIMPSEVERKLFSLPPSKGGLCIPIFREQAEIEFQNSCEIKNTLRQDIINQNVRMDEENQEKIKIAKSVIKERKRRRIEDCLNLIKKFHLRRKTKAYRTEE